MGLKARTTITYAVLACAPVVMALASCRVSPSPDHQPQPRAMASASARRGPAVEIISPRCDDALHRGFRAYVVAAASDDDGFVRKVEFFADGTSVGTDEAPPYGVWFTPDTGSDIRMTAVAWDDDGQRTSSKIVKYTVTECPSGENCDAELPADALQCCVGGAVIHWIGPKPTVEYAAPATVTLEVTARAVEGDVAEVQFFAGDGLLGTVKAAPYRFTWKRVPQGLHHVTARARTTLGIVTESPTNKVRVSTAELK